MACILYMLWPVKCLSFSRIAFHFCKRACSRCLSKRCMISNCPTVAKMYRFPTTRSLTGSHLSSGTHRWENGFQSWWGVQHFAGSFATIESCVVSFEIGCFFSVKSELFVKSHDLLAAPRPSRWCEWLSDVNRQWWWLLLEAAENCHMLPWFASRFVSVSHEATELEWSTEWSTECSRVCRSSAAPPRTPAAKRLLHPTRTHQRLHSSAFGSTKWGRGEMRQKKR